MLALIAQPTAIPGDTGMQRVASTAAGVAEQLVRVAEQGALEANATPDDVAPTLAATPARTPEASALAVEPSPATSARPSASSSSRPRETERPETPRATQSPRATERSDPQKANEVLQTVRKALEETKAAAEKAKSRHK